MESRSASSSAVASQARPGVPRPRLDDRDLAALARQLRRRGGFREFGRGRLVLGLLLDLLDLNGLDLDDQFLRSRGRTGLDHNRHVARRGRGRFLLGRRLNRRLGDDVADRVGGRHGSRSRNGQSRHQDGDDGSARDPAPAIHSGLQAS